jgi:hypothetical protein
MLAAVMALNAYSDHDVSLSPFLWSGLPFIAVVSGSRNSRATGADERQQEVR